MSPQQIRDLLARLIYCAVEWHDNFARVCQIVEVAKRHNVVW